MENKKTKKPFFASFLEKQINDPEKVKGGSGSLTSALEDTVTSALKDSLTTSLQDNVTSRGNDNVTMKYPSDSDESGDEL